MWNIILACVLGLVLLAYLVVVLYVGRLLVYNDVSKRRQPEKGALEGYAVEDVEFEGSERNTLRGWFVRARDNSSQRTVILLHGWHRDRIRLLPHIRLLVDNGFHVLIYDQRAHGSSDTALITFGDGEAGDFIAALGYLSTRDDVDPERIAAIGFSLGTGGIIYAYGKADKPHLKAVVLEGAYSRSFEVGKYMLTQRYGSLVGNLIGHLVFTPGAKIWSLGRFEHSEPIRFIEQLSPTPLLLIRSKTDNMVSLENFEAIRDKAGEPKTLWVHDGGHSRALSTHPRAYAEQVLRFLNEHL